jgi:hypothetical protein
MAKMRPGKVLRIKGRRALSGLVGLLNLKNLLVGPDGKKCMGGAILAFTGIRRYSLKFTDIRPI